MVCYAQKENYNSYEVGQLQMSTIIHRFHRACPQVMRPWLVQEILTAFVNASVHAQVTWMGNGSWSESKTCKSDGGIM